MVDPASAPAVSVLWDSRTLITIGVFVVSQLLIAIVFGAKLGARFDALKEEFGSLKGEVVGFKRDMKSDIDAMRIAVGRVGERIANVEGRLSGRHNGSGSDK